MTPQEQKVMELALKALETELSMDWSNNDEFIASAKKMHEAITAIKEALAQPEQEPVAFKCGDAIVYIKPPVYGTPPPKRILG